MKTFSVPTRETVSPVNQQLFDKVSKGLGKVPNLFATMAYSENAPGMYLALSTRLAGASSFPDDLYN
jgi:hypothetical protein